MTDKTISQLYAITPGLAGWNEIHPERVSRGVHARCFGPASADLQMIGTEAAYNLQSFARRQSQFGIIYFQRWTPEIGLVETEVWRNGKLEAAYETSAHEFNQFVDGVNVPAVSDED